MTMKVKVRILLLAPLHIRLLRSKIIKNIVKVYQTIILTNEYELNFDNYPNDLSPEEIASAIDEIVFDEPNNFIDNILTNGCDITVTHEIIEED